MKDIRRYKHFTTEEFDSPDEVGSGKLMNPEVIERLDIVRDMCGFPVIINSGYRTVSHNKKIGGVSRSSHLSGLAVDISVKDSRKRFLLLSAVIKAGFVRIGLGNGFIHVDIDSEKSQDVIWTYN